MKHYFVKDDLMVSVYANKEQDIILPMAGLVQVDRLEYLTHYYEIKKSVLSALWAVIVKKCGALKKAIKE